MNWRVGVKVTLVLAMVAFCFFQFMLHRQSDIFREMEAALLQTQWMLVVCLAVWCGTFLFLTFSLNDLCLIGLLLVAIAGYFITYAAWPVTDAINLLFGVTLGKGARVLLLRLKAKGEMLNEDDDREFSDSAFSIQHFFNGFGRAAGIFFMVAFGYDE